nr:uncharacterized protein LOC115862557 [Globicephala melas]
MYLQTQIKPNPGVFHWKGGKGGNSLTYSSFPTCSHSLYLLFPGPQAGTRESLGVGRVPMWPLWTILLLVLPLGGLGPPFCPRETFCFLIAIMKLLGSKNDGTLYTADDLLVCPAEALGCFWLELSVIGFEEGPSMETAVFRLQRLLDALRSWLWVTGWGPCPPCGGHPQRPVHLFLAKLLELLQGACAQHLPSARTWEVRGKDTDSLVLPERLRGERERRFGLQPQFPNPKPSPSRPEDLTQSPRSQGKRRESKM